MKRASTSYALIVSVLCFVELAVASPCSAEGDRSDALVAVQQQVEQLRQDYEERIRELEQRLERLEGAATASGEAARAHGISGGNDELEALRKAAGLAAGSQVGGTARGATATTATAGSAKTSAEQAAANVGHERNLNRLNPEISFTGDVVARAEGARKTFDAREFELDLQAALDPFSSTKWTISFAPDEVDVEEGYIKYTGLARGLTLRVGKMRQSFGALNRYHLHALPQPEYPLVLQSFFGEEGLAQTGVSVEWMPGVPWASAAEFTLQLTDGSAEPFGAGSFERLVALATLRHYWDLSASTYLDWGLSAVGGREADKRDSRIWGSDLTLHWQPPARAKYREVTWRSEVLLSQREDPGGSRHDAWGGYSYLEGLLRRNLYAGLHYDFAEDPFDGASERWRIGPYLSWWQSEYVRLRAMYQWARNEAEHDTDHRVLLQFTWAAGPHKHENY